MRIFVAVDSFKGTLSSIEISDIIKSYYEKDHHQVLSVPISDGGEGFLDAIKCQFQEEIIMVDTYGPLGDRIEAGYIMHNNVAFIELSSVCGLNKIDQYSLNPMLTTTYGLGLMVLDAIHKGARKIIFGIGGSATQDAGAGMLQALGVKFFQQGREIKTKMNGEMLGQVTSFDTKLMKKRILNLTFEIVSDVNNPLLGENGSVYVYAKQKGAKKEMQDQLESFMTSYATIVEEKTRKSYRNHQGAGAAGGFGFGAMTFLNAEMHSGIDYMIELLEIESKIKNSDIVFVGEGKLDKQTLFGKAPFGIAKIAKKYHKKVIGVFAMSDQLDDYNFLDEIYIIVPTYASQKDSIDHPKKALREMLSDIKLTK